MVVCINELYKIVKTPKLNQKPRKSYLHFHPSSSNLVRRIENTPRSLRSTCHSILNNQLGTNNKERIQYIHFKYYIVLYYCKEDKTDYNIYTPINVTSNSSVFFRLIKTIGKYILINKKNYTIKEIR